MFKKSIFFVLIIWMLASCSSNQVKSNQSKLKDFVKAHDLQPAEHVRLMRIVSWTPLDDRSLIISSGHKKQFLIETSGGCFNLRSATQIALKQRQEYRLSRGFDSILVYNFGSQEQCDIFRIYPIDEEQKSALLEMN